MYNFGAQLKGPKREIICLSSAPSCWNHMPCKSRSYILVKKGSVTIHKMLEEVRSNETTLNSAIFKTIYPILNNIFPKIHLKLYRIQKKLLFPFFQRCKTYVKYDLMCQRNMHLHSPLFTCKHLLTQNEQ